jgi:hypothetical protein
MALEQNHSWYIQRQQNKQRRNTGVLRFAQNDVNFHDVNFRRYSNLILLQPVPAKKSSLFYPDLIPHLSL